MSETGPGLTLDQDEIDPPEKLRGSCERFMPEFKVKIVDPTPCINEQRSR
jgi:hypothetical protein